MKNETTPTSKAKTSDTTLATKETMSTPTSKSAKPTTSTQKPDKGVPETKKSETGDTRYVYCYVLGTKKQREAIDLLKSKSKLEKLFKHYFGKRLLSVVINTDSYTLSLTDEFKVGEKRMLGRSVGGIDDMKSHANKVYYNNGQDFSTQLFKLKEVK